MEMESLTVKGSEAICLHKTKLVSITLPISVSVMGEGVFFGCTELESFVLSPNVPYIKPMTFAQCSFKEFSVPESIKSIEKNAFAGCSSLAKLVIPENVTTIVGRSLWRVSGIERNKSG